MERLRELTSQPTGRRSEATDEAQLWFWIAFALGLAQLSVLADAGTFSATLAAFRSQFDPGTAPPTSTVSEIR